MTDIRQSENYALYLKSQGWIIERINNINYFIKKLPLIGNVLKIQRPDKISFEDINLLSKKYSIFQIIIEPKNNVSAQKLLINEFKLSKSPYLPSKTLHLNLAQSADKIYANFSKNCRYALRRGRENIIKEYSTPKDLKIFHNAWKKSVNFTRYIPNLKSLLNFKKSFPNDYSIFLASHNNSGDIMGGALFTQSLHGTAYYWYGFTNKNGRASLSQYSLLYQGILWGKKQGCRIFDFEGIFDPRFPNQNWLGFSHFKRSFGGYEVEYPGCYVKLNLGNIFPRFRLKNL